MIDCIIVGGGPAGLSAAVNLRQRGREVLVLCAGPSVLKKAELVDNCVGLPQMSGPAMLEVLEAHALAKGARIEHKKAANILPFGDSFMVNADGDILECRSIILACGTARAKAIPGEEEFLGRGVSYCATCDGMLYRGRRCVVWGLAENAAEEANYLSEIGVDITFVAARRPEQLHGSIRFVAGRLNAVEGGSTVERVVLPNETVNCEGVFILRSAIAPGRLLEGLEVRDGAIVVDRQMNTAIPGVFAAGDCTGEPLQVSKAMGEGQIAGLSAAAWCARSTV